MALQRAPVVFDNDDGTCSFIAFPASAEPCGRPSKRRRTSAQGGTPPDPDVGDCASPLKHLIGAVDGTLRRFGQPVYYRPAIPHASVAWYLAPSEACDPSLRPDGDGDAARRDRAAALVHVRWICAKIGNQLFKLPLQDSWPRR
jgi:hypothetical protein